VKPVRPLPGRSRRAVPLIAAAPPARLADDELPPLDLSIPPWPLTTVAVDGVTMAVRSTPSTGPTAEPALYVHGLGGSATNWTDLAALLAPWLDGEAIDLAGFGHSGPAPGGDYSLAAHTRSVVSYLRQSGRGPVHLLGNSMGGAVAILVAARHPELVRTLTLISPAVPDLRPRLAVHDPFLPLAALPALGPAALRRLDRMSPEQRARGIIELCFADPSCVPPNRLAEAVAEVRRRSAMGWSSDAFVRSLRGLIGAYLQPGARSMWALLRAISAPTLIVWGNRDRLVDVALAPRVANSVPHARLLVLDRVGHVAQMEQPVTTARAVLGMLQDARQVTG
jgi:pimeloyl-ACP methyl ester carboxylesterase